MLACIPSGLVNCSISIYALASCPVVMNVCFVQELESRYEDSLRRMDMEVIRKLDQQVVDQQLFLEKASVPGFTVTNNPTDIQLQMYLIGFIATLSRSSVHV